MRISHSKLSRYLDCPRVYYFNDVLRLVPHYDPEYLRDGVLMHAALAALYSSDDVDAAMEAIERRLRLEPLTLPQEEWDTQAKLEWYRRILTAYDQHRRKVDDFEVLALEVEFVVPIGFPTPEGVACWSCNAVYPDDLDDELCPQCKSTVFYLEGRADQVVKHRGTVKILDHKCPRSAGDDYLNACRYMLQPIGYAYGVAKCTEFPVSGYIINVIKMLKTIGQGGRRIRHTPFLRMDKLITKDDVNRMLHSFVEVAVRMHHDTEFPMREAHCRRRCPYVHVCWQGNAEAWRDPDPITAATYYKEKAYHD